MTPQICPENDQLSQEQFRSIHLNTPKNEDRTSIRPPRRKAQVHNDVLSPPFFYCSASIMMATPIHYCNCSRIMLLCMIISRARSFAVQQSFRAASSRAHQLGRRSRSDSYVPAFRLNKPPSFVPNTSRLHSSLVNDTDSYTSWGVEDIASKDGTEDELMEGVDASLENDAEQQQQDSPLLEEYTLWLKATEKAIKRVEKKQRSLQSEWEKAQTVEETMARAQLLVSNLYLFPSPNVREATVQDWENDGQEVVIKLDPQYETASAEADALFDKARKLKRGSKVIQELLTETERALATLKDAQMDFESAATSGENRVVDEGRLRLIQDRLERTTKLTKFQSPRQISQPSRQSRNKQQQQRPASPYTNIRKLTSPGGCPVLVGRNRRGNEYLSFQVARGKDVWMHSRGCPGAHVLIQWRRGGAEPTDDCWQFAANLAIFYSDNRNEQKAPVTAAEAKHLLKPRGAPLGALKLRQELKVLVGRPDEVPEALKLARDESGQSDEYRSSDKAKHRRHTQKVAKETQAKRRAEQKAKRKRRNRDA